MDELEILFAQLERLGCQIRDIPTYKAFRIQRMAVDEVQQTASETCHARQQRGGMEGYVDAAQGNCRTATSQCRWGICQRDLLDLCLRQADDLLWRFWQGDMGMEIVEQCSEAVERMNL